MALPASLPVKRRGPRTIDPEQKLEFHSVGLLPRRWRWLRRWCISPDVDTPTGWLNSLCDRAEVFFPDALETRPPKSDKPRKRRLPAKLKQVAAAQGVAPDELVYRAVVEYLERQP